MLKRGSDLYLAEKTFPADRYSQFGTQYLESYLPVVLEILCEEDIRHAAAADFSFDRVPATESSRKTIIEAVQCKICTIREDNVHLQLRIR